MKLFKFIPLLLVLTFYNSNSLADTRCDEIKGNVVGKLFCKAKSNSEWGSSGSDSSSEISDSSSEKSGWKFWKKPEWMKKKN